MAKEKDQFPGLWGPSPSGTFIAVAAGLDVSACKRCPITSASVSAATAVKPGFFRTLGKANLWSFMVCSRSSVG